MNKSESKYFNTARCMDEALISLLKVKNLEYITVKEICEKAGVNRSTFYLHYETIADLVNETIEAVNQRFMSYFADTKGIAEELNHTDLSNLVLITRDYLYPYLRFINENKDLYRVAFRNPNEMQANVKYGYIKKYIIEPILKRFGVPDAYWRYYIAYYIDGTMAIIKEWLETGCQDSVEMIAAVIEECVRPADGTQGRMYSEIHKTPADKVAPKKVE
ncbi:MAG TPA: TetR/AcrR family transcriptional regulator [Firmicutes bacterium]|nr:TetR/AcrR family transcriptional regulator [Bacillota bacterium]